MVELFDIKFMDSPDIHRGSSNKNKRLLLKKKRLWSIIWVTFLGLVCCLVGTCLIHLKDSNRPGGKKNYLPLDYMVYASELAAVNGNGEEEGIEHYLDFTASNNVSCQAVVQFDIYLGELWKKLAVICINGDTTTVDLFQFHMNASFSRITFSQMEWKLFMENIFDINSLVDYKWCNQKLLCEYEKS